MNRRSALAMLGAAPLAMTALPARADTTIRFGASATESFGESYFVLDGGFLTKAGLSGNVMTFTNGAQLIAAVSGGSLDVGMSDMTQIANAVNRGLPFSFFAGGSVYRTEVPVTLLCVSSESTMRSPKDLEGKVVGVNGLRTLAEISTRETVRLAGGNPDKVEFVEIGPALAISALQRGTVAAAVVSEPFLSGADSTIKRFAKPYDAIAKSFYICNWFAKSDWLAADPPATQKLVAAIYEAAAWTNTHHDASLPILTKNLKIDPTHLKNLTRATFATTLDPKLMQPVLDIGLRYGLLKTAVDARSLITKQGA
jgi:NitT/TauT family transport system substrate-binding protein